MFHTETDNYSNIFINGNQLSVLQEYNQKLDISQVWLTGQPFYQPPQTPINIDRRPPEFQSRSGGGCSA